MDKTKNLKQYNYIYLILASLVILLSVVVGLISKESVFFSYDMPRVALKVQEYLNNGSYITSQYYFSESSWLNVAWGPALIFFYAILISLTPDPIIISYLLVIINALAVLSVILIGWRFFSEKVGIFAGLFIAFNPYLFTYSRIIYQPSPITFLIPVSMFLFFELLNKRKYPLLILPTLWVAMFQIYIPTFSIILVSLLFLLFILKLKDYKYLLIGGLISIVLIFPSIVFFKDNPFYIKRFFDAPNHFNPREKTYSQRVKNVITSFIKIPVGGMFKWQTGGSYKDFIKFKVPQYETISLLFTILFVSSILIESYLSIVYKDVKRAIVVGWTICAFWYLCLLWTIDLVPRYFLLSIPPAMLLLAIFFGDVIDLFKRYRFFKFIAFIPPVFIGFYWLIFNIKYNDFIKNYSFPHGWFSDIAETPYIYIKNAMDYVIDDSNKNSCIPIISNDVSNKNFVLWMETEYPWKYIYDKSVIINSNSNNCYYLITHLSILKDNKYTEYVQFGPFGVARND